LTTYVLIHGAFQGGWIWKPTAERLRAAGHLVFAPSLEGCGDRRNQLREGITTETHATEVAELVFYEDLRDVVLVGTSLGGMVVCKTAELVRERVGRMVFIDALALFDGERPGDIVRGSKPWIHHALAHELPRQQAETNMFAGLKPPLRAWALDRYTPQPVGTMEFPVHLGSFWSQTWEANVICCLRSANPGAGHQRRTAEKLDGTFIELDSGHFPMLSDPDALAPLLMQH